jgi:hypothetical protein
LRTVVLGERPAELEALIARRLFVLVGDHDARAERRALLDASAAELHESVAWPGFQ